MSKKAMIVISAVIALMFLGTVMVGLVGAYVWSQFIHPTMVQPFERPAVLDSPGVIKADLRISQDNFAPSVSLYGVSDLQWGRFIPDREPVLVAVTSDEVYIVDEAGWSVGNLSFPERSGSVRLVNTGPNEHDFVFVGGGSWTTDAALFDKTGRQLWNHSSDMGVNHMAAGDLTGNGELDFVVGFNGSGGISMLDSQGNRVWNMRGANIWHVEIADIAGDGVMRIVHSDAGGNLIIRDANGRIVSQSKPAGYFSHFSLAHWPTPDSPVYILHPNAHQAILIDESGAVVQSFSAPDTNMHANLIGKPVKFAADEEYHFAVLTSLRTHNGAILYIYDSAGELIYQEAINFSCGGMTTRRNESTGLDQLFLGCNDMLRIYEPSNF